MVWRSQQNASGKTQTNLICHGKWEKKTVKRPRTTVDESILY